MAWIVCVAKVSRTFIPLHTSVGKYGSGTKARKPEVISFLGLKKVCTFSQKNLFCFTSSHHIPKKGNVSIHCSSSMTCHTVQSYVMTLLSWSYIHRNYQNIPCSTHRIQWWHSWNPRMRLYHPPFGLIWGKRTTRRKHVRTKSFQTPYKHTSRVTFLLQAQKLFV